LGEVRLNEVLIVSFWVWRNSAGLVIDAVRLAMLALNNGVAGPLIGPSAYFMKSPPVQFSDDAAREMVEEFILGNGQSASADWTAFFDSETVEA
jgi:myo-inositol-1-phosphate synthase